MKSFFKDLFSFKFSTKRLILAIALVVIFVIVGIVVDMVYKHYDTPKKYEKEIESKLELNDKEIIKSQKYDLNLDGINDYIAIIGKPKKNDESNITELYLNLEVIFIDGNSDKVIRYDTKKNFTSNVTFEVTQDKVYDYIFVTDSSDGNVAMLKLKENKFIDIIKESFGENFNGYTIDMNFDKEDSTKLNVTLDNYNKSYLESNDKVYVLDFSDVCDNLDKYRQTYNLDKFQKIELKDVNSDGVFELVTTQYILYLYKEADDMTDNLGNVTTTFRYENGKYKFDKVEVSI